MKKSNNNMDDIFKDHFLNTSVEVEQSDALWESIQQERKEPNRKFLLWFLVAGILLGSLAIYNIYSNPQETTVKTVTPLAEQSSNAKEKITKPEATIDMPQTNKITSASTKETSTTQKKSFIKTDKVIRQNLQQQVNPFSSINLTTTNITENKAIENIIVTNEKVVSKPFTTKTEAFTKSKQNTTTNIPNINTSIPVIENLPMDNWNPLIINKKRKKTKWSKCSVKTPGTLFIDAYGQAALTAMEQITEMDDAEMTSTYREDWEARFSPFLSYQGGLQLGYITSWGGYVSAGLSYQHFQTKYEDNQRVVETITIFDDRAYFYQDANGETVWVADSVTVTNIYDRTNTFANNHKLWHIPFQLGFVTDRNRFRIGANVEALFNISKSYEGQFLNPNGSLSVINSNQDADYISTNIGVSLSAGLHLGYLLNDHMELYLSPRFRFNNQSYLHDSQSLSINRHFAGARLGLKYHF